MNAVLLRSLYILPAAAAVNLHMYLSVTASVPLPASLQADKQLTTGVDITTRNKSSIPMGEILYVHQTCLPKGFVLSLVISIGY